MIALSLIFVSSIVLSILGYIGIRYFEKSHSWISLALILVQIILPLGIYLPGITIASESSIGMDGSGLPWVQVLACFWGVGLLVAFTRLSQNYYAFKRWSNSAVITEGVHNELMHICKQIGVKNVPRVKVADDISAPVIGGIIHPTLFLPTNYTSWSAETREMVLWHELGHLVRKDLWKLVLGQLGSCLYWFNPLVRGLRNSLSAHCELACDNWVMNRGVDRKTYLNALCDVAESAVSDENHRFALSMADHVSLSERVKILVDKPRKKNPIIVGAFVLTIAMIGLAIVSLKPKAENYTGQEIELRLSANPFPMD